MDGHNGVMASAVSYIPRRNTLPAVENIRLHRGNLNVILRSVQGFSRYITPKLCFFFPFLFTHANI